MYLGIERITVNYSGKPALRDVSLDLGKKEIVSIIGHPGCGKSSVLLSVFGLIKVESGRIMFEDRDISNRDSATNIKSGILLVPQGGRIFYDLTVAENLEMGGYILPNRKDIESAIKNVFSFFPILEDRRKQMAGSLSGGGKANALSRHRIDDPT